jgi:hypothetical protein
MLQIVKLLSAPLCSLVTSNSTHKPIPPHVHSHMKVNLYSSFKIITVTYRKREIHSSVHFNL